MSEKKYFINEFNGTKLNNRITVNEKQFEERIIELNKEFNHYSGQIDSSYFINILYDFNGNFIGYQINKRFENNL